MIGPFEDVSPLLKRVEILGKSLDLGTPQARKELLSIVKRLYLALETPMEAIIRMEWAEPTLHSATRIAIQLGIFDKLKEGGSNGLASNQIAGATGADAVLLSRILKHLASMGMVLEVGSDMYAPTTLSNALTIPKYRDGIPYCFDINTPAIHSLPNPFQIGHSTTKHIFEYLGDHPESGRHFNNHMEGYTSGRAMWYEKGCVPVEELFGATASHENDAVLLVDVGGGTGRDIVGFHHQCRDIPGRLVLQDLPAVIDGAKNLPEAVQPMAHDFFTTQPIKGAHAYYMHSVLHDWPKEKCQKILRNIIPSMKKGYSKILINENVISDRDANWLITSLDIVMMSVCASGERTESTWRQLLESVGLKVMRIWTYEQETESLIEAVLA